MKKTKKRRVSRQNRLQSRIVLGIVFVVFLAIGVNSYRTYLTYQELKAKEAEVDMAIAEAEAEYAALEAREEYMETEDYIRDVAREEFGMVEPGEYLLKSESEED